MQSKTHALMAPTLHDELINVANICSVNHEEYMDELPLIKTKRLLPILERSFQEGLIHGIHLLGDT